METDNCKCAICDKALENKEAVPFFGKNYHRYLDKDIDIMLYADGLVYAHKYCLDNKYKILKELGVYGPETKLVWKWVKKDVQELVIEECS